jgi:hypothetical protein
MPMECEEAGAMLPPFLLGDSRRQRVGVGIGRRTIQISENRYTNTMTTGTATMRCVEKADQAPTTRPVRKSAWMSPTGCWMIHE